jgi:hypothetical protein
MAAVICNEILYALPDLGRQLDRMRSLLPTGGHLLTSDIRHPGDVGLRRMLAERFELVNAVELSDGAGGARRRRRVAAYRKPG